MKRILLIAATASVFIACGKRSESAADADTAATTIGINDSLKKDSPEKDSLEK